MLQLVWVSKAVIWFAQSVAPAIRFGRPACVSQMVYELGTITMGANYFDDEQEIGPQALILLRKVLVDLRETAGTVTEEEELGIARELVALFKSGFRTEEELKAMAGHMPLLNKQI